MTELPRTSGSGRGAQAPPGTGSAKRRDHLRERGRRQPAEAFAPHARASRADGRSRAADERGRRRRLGARMRTEARFLPRLKSHDQGAYPHSTNLAFGSGS